MPVDCTAGSLVDLAACFQGLSPKQHQAIATYLLCQIANGGGGGGGTPGGTNGQFQFNNAGEFGGAPNLTYDTGTGDVIVGQNIIVVGIVSGSGNIETSADMQSGGNMIVGGVLTVTTDIQSNGTAFFNSLTVGGALVAATANITDLQILNFVTGPTTVSGLPPAGTVGRRSFVDDSQAPVFGQPVVGLGATPVPVYDDGVTWRVG